MSTTDPITAVLAQLTAIDTASAAIQHLVGTYPAGTAGIATVEGYLATINSACASVRALAATAQSTPTTPLPLPVPPPVPPTIPASTPPLSTGITPLLHDDCTGYANTAALQQAIAAKTIYTDGWQQNLVSLDTNVLYNGHPTMKLSMPGGQKNCPALWAKLPNALDILWFRTKIRFSPGFTTTGTIGGGNAFKLLAWGHDTYDGSGRLEIANTNQYQLYWNIQAKGSGSLVGGGQYALDGTISSEWSDSGWYDYIIKVDRSKGTVATIGWWMAKDGSTPVSKGNTTEAMLNGSQMPHITSVGFAIEFNQQRAATQNQALWIGQWEVISGTQSPNPYGL